MSKDVFGNVSSTVILRCATLQGKNTQPDGFGLICENTPVNYAVVDFYLKRIYGSLFDHRSSCSSLTGTAVTLFTPKLIIRSYEGWGTAQKGEKWGKGK